MPRAKPSRRGTTHSIQLQESRETRNELRRQERKKQEALGILFNHIAPGAFHNSEDRHDPPKCHPRTREAVLKAILNWAQDPNNLRLLMWIYGPAGAGKSAIMQTIAEMCEEAGILGASFFFFRTADKRNIKTHLVTTIAYQLMRKIPQLGQHVLTAIRDDPSIFDRTLATQMKALILDPMAVVAAHNPDAICQLYIILVDGLDECSPEDAHREIVTLLSNAAAYPFRFLIASRPELIIRDSFALSNVSDRTQRLELDNSYSPSSDIRTFLTDKLSDIKSRHPLHLSIPESWPSKRKVDELVWNASGQFIYASTVIKYIDSPRHNPIHRLDSLLDITEQSDLPFAQLDALYHHILARVDDIEKVMHILHCLQYLEIRIRDEALSIIERVLGYSPGQAAILLCDMHSLLCIDPTNDNVQHFVRKIKFHHASFGDFLSSPQRARHLYVEPQEVHTFLAQSILTNYDELTSPKGIFKGVEFAWLFPDILSLCTAEALSTLLFGFNFNIFRNISYLWLSLDNGDNALIFFGLLELYYKWLKNQKAIKLYDDFLNHLDIWLENLLQHCSGDVVFNAIVMLIAAVQLQSLGWRTTCKYLLKTLSQEYGENYVEFGPYAIQIGSGFTAALREVMLNPQRNCFQLLQRTNFEMTLLEHYLDEIPGFQHWKSGHGFGGQFSSWTESLLEWLLNARPMPDAGNRLLVALSSIDQREVVSIWEPYIKKCTLPGHKCARKKCQNRKQVALTNVKRDLYRLAVSARDYLKRCNVDPNMHAYTSEHLICISCQSSNIFLEDEEFGDDFLLGF